MTDPFFRRVLAGLVLGVFAGLFVGEAVWPLKFGADVFIKLLQVTVLPYMLGSVIVGIGGRSASDAVLLARRGGLLLLLVWMTVLLWVAVTALVYPGLGSPGLFPGDGPNQAEIDWIDLYVPANVFHALANNLLPAVVLFSILAGAALSGMPAELKEPLLRVMDGFNEAMRRVNRFIVRLTPYGLFAMAASAAGTLRVDEFLRLQIWFVVYIGSACLLALWLLPGLVALVTPLSYRRFMGSLQTALVTAFAAGDYFVVLPMIVEANRRLFEEQGVSPHEAEGTVGVAVPLLYNFPHAGKLLTLAFFPFGAWFSGVTLGVSQWLTLCTAGVLSLFGNLNVVIPFLLDLLRLPADLFNLFTVSSVLNQRFGALVAAMHTAALSAMVAASLLGMLKVSVRRLARTALVASLALVAFVVGTRVVFSRVIPPLPTGLAALQGFTLRHGEDPAQVRVPEGVPEDPGPPGERLKRVLARRVLKVGFFGDGVPFTFYNAEGALVGYDVEMALSLGGSMGVSVEFVPIGRNDLARALDTGACDIVMSGIVIIVETAETMEFSEPYHEERVGVLVLDHRRGEFSQLSQLLTRSLIIGAPSDRYVLPIRRRLPQADVRPFSLQTVLETGEMREVDALVLPMDQAYYASRVQPAFAAVVPEDTNLRGVVAYALPTGADSLRNLVNTWIQVTRAAGSFSDAYDYWVRGRAQTQRTPRWSIARDVLGLW